MKLSAIKPNPSNPRLIKDDKFKKLVQSINDFPKMMELRPIIIDDDNIILGGNMRYRALQELKMKDIPDEWVKKASDLTDEEKKQFIIKDNVGFGEWDYDQLANEWEAEDLDRWGLDIPVFDAEPEKIEAVEDDYEIPDTIKTDIVLGDLFEIGQHRLLCGDSTKIDDVEKLMNGNKADMVFADPPYGISIVNKKSGKVGAGNLAKNKEYSPVIGDDTTDTARAFYNTCIAFEMKNFIIWGGNYFVNFLPFSSSWIIWDKRGDMTSNNFADGEMAWCSFDTRVRIYKQIWNGMIREGEKEARVHPTQKPVKMLAEIITDHLKGDLLYDGFLGSGSTMVASHQLNRKCYGMELDPKYCQVIVDRMLKLDPTLEIKRNGEKYVNNCDGAVTNA